MPVLLCEMVKELDSLRITKVCMLIHHFAGGLPRKHMKMDTDKAKLIRFEVTKYGGVQTSNKAKGSLKE